MHDAEANWLVNPADYRIETYWSGASYCVRVEKPNGKRYEVCDVPRGRTLDVLMRDVRKETLAIASSSELPRAA